MSDSAATALTAATVVGGCLNAGVYVAFAAIVMPALGSLAPSDAVATMGRINAAAVRPPFMAIFFGCAAAAVALVAVELGSHPIDGRTVARVVGAGLVLASHAVTVAANVPLNNALAALGPDRGVGDRFWPAFARRWGRANAMRAAAALAGSSLLLVSLPAATG